MPGLIDLSFNRSVVYLCEHSERGALGLVINKPSDLDLQTLFDRVELHLDRPDLAAQPVLQGGPVHTERGFVLHEAMRVDTTGFNQAHPDPTDGKKESTVYASTLAIPGGLEMTASSDVLQALASGAGPRKLLFSLGYAAWEQGQLESEIADNSWLTVGADPKVIFDTPIAQRYERALGLLGFQPWMLAPEAGHA